MTTTNSLSGGKTSSYMAIHYPADHEIFSLVRIEEKKCSPPEWLRKKVEDKIEMDFVATTEDDETLKLMFELEQQLGREIIWVSGETFEQLIERKAALPNQFWRFCTTELKVKPIFEWWQKNINEIIEMRCGYRHDERDRKDAFTTSFKVIVGKSKSGKRNQWGEIEWRTGKFPMIDEKINVFDILKFWRERHNGIRLGNFPPDSNCVGCFWKSPTQLRINWERNPEKMHWFANLETKKRRWKKEGMYDDFAKLGLQQNMLFNDAPRCGSGECTP